MWRFLPQSTEQRAKWRCERKSNSQPDSVDLIVPEASYVDGASSFWDTVERGSLRGQALVRAVLWFVPAPLQQLQNTFVPIFVPIHRRTVTLGRSSRAEHRLPGIWRKSTMRTLIGKFG